MAQLEIGSNEFIGFESIDSSLPPGTKPNVSVTYINFYCYTEKSLDFNKCTLIRDLQRDYIKIDTEEYDLFLSVNDAYSSFIESDFENLNEGATFVLNTVSLNGYTQLIEPLYCNSELSVKLGSLYMVSNTEISNVPLDVTLDKYIEIGEEIEYDDKTIKISNLFDKILLQWK